MEGTIPGQDPNVNIYYFFGAEDNSNNTSVFDSNFVEYSAGIVPTNIFSFGVQLNWELILIIVGIVVGVVVGSFLLYSYSGSYIDRMRR